MMDAFHSSSRYNNNNNHDSTSRAHDIGTGGKAAPAVSQWKRLMVLLQQQQQQEHEQQHEQQTLRQQQQQRRPSISLSDSGHESDLRRSALASTNVYATFARRPSWIADEEDHDDAWKYVDKFLEMDITSSMAEEVEDIPVVVDHGTTGVLEPQRQQPPPLQPQVMSRPPTAVDSPSRSKLQQRASAIAFAAALPLPPTGAKIESVFSARDRGASATTTTNNHDDPSHSLLKASLMSFDARMSTNSNPFRRSSLLSGRSSLRNFTTPFRFSDVSMASEIFESFSAPDDDENDIERHDHRKDDDVFVSGSTTPIENDMQG
jgi:hypothetical protein